MVPSDVSAPTEPVAAHLPESEKQTQCASIIPEDGRLQMQRTISTVSHHDMADVGYVVTGDADEIYNRYSERRKTIIVAVMSFCSFLAPVSSTTVLSAVPEVAATFNTDGSIINVSNALYMLFMGISPCFYGPYGNICGRKWVSVASAILFFAFSIGTALAPNLASFFIFRILTAFQGTAFLIVGNAVIGDIYKPTERATAMGWFLSGTLIGPALGPFIGGIIVTFRSWRDIFWLQTALAGAATVFCFFLQPETIHEKRSRELEGLPLKERAKKMWQWLNPARILRLYRYPNLLLVALASSSLVWNMYSLLTPIRYVLNPRFDLTSPFQSGLFYIAPGCGYLVGTFVGGRYADFVVKKYITKRGHRESEDRLRSCILFLGGVIPACMIIYGWGVEKRVGGVALPVVMMFLQGVAQLFCFPSLNTYCLDVMQSRSAEVVAGNYFMRYMFAAAGSAACLPAVRAVGVGWFSTISALFLVAGAGATYLTALYGKTWREAIDEKKAAKKEGGNQV
ncbi:MFS general substrate transporter [Setomelanomma holmii]|uniref:MFS general substrate transporter n=1 Tax=Setomelanomma holmii TaxID=210430 RepID=A0A9P4H232_9PLEO|nr:MFS general substrate transporter [Setomelanomma holmii]